MTEKKSTRNGRVSVSTWLSPEEVKRLDANVARLSKKLLDEYPGAKLTRHAVLQKIILEWLDSQKGKK